MSSINRIAAGLLVILFVSKISSSTSSVNGFDSDTQSRVNRICQKSFDYYLCHDIFSHEMRSDVSDYKELSIVAAEAALSYTTDSYRFYRDLEESETNPAKRDEYKVCYEGYGLVLGQVQKAAVALAQNDVKGMLSDLSNLESFVNDCDSVLGRNRPLNDRNHHEQVVVKMPSVSGELIGTFI